jgi:dolichol-phosphate mannosyltransferase
VIAAAMAQISDSLDRAAAARNDPISVSIAAPAYNEEAGIGEIITEWLRFLRACPDVERFEIVVCNDGSRDRTGAIIRDIARENPEVEPVDLERNQGAAVALKTAIAQTRLEWVLLLDSDGQFPVENLPGMLAALRKKQVQAVIGVRQKKDVLFARLGTWSSGVVCNWLYGTRLRDFNSACKLLSGPVVRSLHLEAKGMNYSTEVTARLLECGVAIAEVDIEHRPRRSGTSNMRLIRGSIHRLLFVCYLGFRQLLFRLAVLQRPIV